MPQVDELPLKGVRSSQSGSQLDRREAARLEAAGLPTHEEHAWTAGGPRASFEVVLPLGHHLGIGVGASVTALVQKELRSDGDLLVLRPLVTVGLALQRRF